MQEKYYPPPPPNHPHIWYVWDKKSEHRNRGLYWIYRFPLSPVSTIWRNHLPFNPPTGSLANTTIVVFLYILDIDSHCPYLLLFFKTKYILFFVPRIIFSRDVGNSIKCKKNIIPPPNHPHIWYVWDKKSEHRIEDYIGYIDSHCPRYLLFGETTSHLTIKWRGTFQ